jgi:hypothetical protein
MCFTSMFLNVLRSTSLAAVILLSSVSEARSDQWMVQNGEVLLASCVSNDSWAGSCMGFVTAIASVISENQIYGLRACIPREATPRNLIAVAIEWLSSQSPEGRQSDAASLVAEAISRRFPCAKEKSP